MSTGKKANQSGFTLIEALIAFVVLTVGILGALLFHSTLIKESGVSKAQVEALKIAERTIEEQRGNAVYPTAGAFYDALSTAANSTIASVAGTNDIYSLSWGAPTAVSGSSDVYLQNLTVSWSQGSIDLATYFSWIDPNKTIAADEADSGDGGGYNGDIPIPTGTMSALTREEIAVVSAEEQAAFNSAADARPGIRKYEYDGENIVAVDVGDNTYVKLVKLSDPDNEIMTISGKIYNSWTDSDRRVELKFAPVYKQADGTYEDEIIDVRATGGANCVVGDYSNYDSTTGEYATYLCVAGTGWNGTIYPYYRTIDGSTLKEIDIQEVQGVDAMVCAPRQRSYRYYIVTINAADDLDTLNTIIKNGSVGTVSSATQILDDLGASLAGQSGLVRFYPTASEADASSEGVYWGNYFWHNPEYIVSPALTSATISLANPSSTAMEGYHVSPFASGANESVNYPGDVAYQNFFLAVPTVGNGGSAVTWDCDDVVSEALASFASGASSSQTNAAYLLDHGMPGYQSDPTVSGALPERGYVPSTQANYAVDDYNIYGWSSETQGGKTVYSGDFRGSFILGYTLATNTISGYIKYPLALPGTFELAGNPEPVVSIECTLDTNKIIDGLYYEQNYSCGIPANWTGNILAYYTIDDDNVDYCKGTGTASESVASGEPKIIPASPGVVSIADLSVNNVSPSTAYPAVQYFANNVLSGGQDSVDSSDLGRLGVHIYGTAVGDSQEGKNFLFTNTGLCF